MEDFYFSEPMTTSFEGGAKKAKKSRKGKKSRKTAKRAQSKKSKDVKLTLYGYRTKKNASDRKESICNAAEDHSKSAVEKKLKFLYNVNKTRNPSNARRYATDLKNLKTC
jgi:hypothetical protein